MSLYVFRIQDKNGFAYVDPSIDIPDASIERVDGETDGFEARP
jgi:hypothetical protein